MTRNSYEERVAKETRFYAEKQVVVHDLPASHHYWAEKYVKPYLRQAGFADVRDVFYQAIPAVREERGEHPIRIASLGSGDASLELGVLQRAVEAGLGPVSLDCFELVEVVIERARAAAAAQGLADLVRFRTADLNRLELDQPYDLFFANHSLHHMLELERLFDGVARQMPPWGILVVNDMIGRNGHLRWPEALARIDAIWSLLPERYKRNHQLARVELQFEDWDCSTDGFEGIRAQEILPLLIERFEFDLFVGFANLVDPFIDRSFGPNFDPERPLDRAILDFVAELDRHLLEGGELTPTHLIAWLRTEKREPKRGWIPLPPADCVRRP